LAEVCETEESRCFNATFSKIRIEVENARQARLHADPLLARMRISAYDPPLTTFMQRIDKELSLSHIVMKVELTSNSGSVTGLSLQVPFTATADQAIKMILKKILTLERRPSATTIVPAPSDTSGDSSDDIYRSSSLTFTGKKDTDDVSPRPKLHSEDYALTLLGMDEVLAGPIPLTSFVCVRHFLLSAQRILNLILKPKIVIIEEITARELSTSSLLPEVDPQVQRDEIQVDGVSHTQKKSKFEVYVEECSNLHPRLYGAKLQLTVSLIHGVSVLCESVSTIKARGGQNITFNQTISLSIDIASLPRAARLAFTLRSQKSDRMGAVATYNFAVFQFNGLINSGKFTKRMWTNHDFDFFLTTCESNEEKPILLKFRLPTFHVPIKFIPSPPATSFPVGSSDLVMSQSAVERLDFLAQADQLEPLTEADRKLLWDHRAEILDKSPLLPFVIASVDYSKPTQVSEIPLLLQSFTPLEPTEALSLLDAKYADPDVRTYAVKCLEQFRDDQIMLFLLQLVQALKYELYDDSPLARFLFRRGLQEPKFLGHQLFWQLISEAHLSHIAPRFSILLVNFVYGIGSSRDELLQGYQFTQALLALNKDLAHLDYDEATGPFREKLKQIPIPDEFHLPMDPRLIVNSFIFEQCKVMNSKKKPFWLTFRNASMFATEPVRTMFKVGDDLRQDQLTLQVMKVMESLWRVDGADFHMRCYGVLPTGLGQGFIEVVPNAVTESDLQKKRGTIAGVWATDLFTKYFEDFNPGPALARASTIFRQSSAGYAVATSVLGLADRHPGNIMVQQDGHFFHIDFGHFLGNWKMRFGVKREGGLFHFSPAAVSTIGQGSAFAEFENEAVKALEILRKNSRLLISLFLLMIGTGIPELNQPDDVGYVKKMLYLEMTSEQAAATFKRLIKKSHDSTRTKLNNLCHNLKTG
jgi:phosphatidylinositol-4,5-bisphosphate 3-kinase